MLCTREYVRHMQGHVEAAVNMKKNEVYVKKEKESDPNKTETPVIYVRELASWPRGPRRGEARRHHGDCRLFIPQSGLHKSGKGQAKGYLLRPRESLGILEIAKENYKFEKYSRKITNLENT